MAKAGIAVEQLVFSSLLSSEKTAHYFIPLLIGIMVMDALIMVVIFYYALPNSGLVARDSEK